MSFFTHSFEAPILLHEIGKGPRTVTYKVVVLPEQMQSDLPFDEYPRLRVDGEIADIPFNGAWQPVGNGRYYLMVPKTVFTEARVKVDDVVEVRFRIADQNAVDVPQALLDALDSDEKFAHKWQALTAGKQRAFAHRVASAKTEPTIQKRIDEVRHMVIEGLSYGKGGKIS